MVSVDPSTNTKTFARPTEIDETDRMLPQFLAHEVYKIKTIPQELNNDKFHPSTKMHPNSHHALENQML
jgi:lysophospholipase L1-like esterase